MIDWIDEAKSLHEFGPIKMKVRRKLIHSTKHVTMDAFDELVMNRWGILAGLV